MSNSLRNGIFKEELLELRQGNYISQEDYEKIQSAHVNFCYNLEREKDRRFENMKKQEMKSQTVTKLDGGSVVLSSDGQTTTSKERQLEHKTVNTKRQEDIEKLTSYKSSKNTVSQSNIREKNITLILILGVILVLTSGLILATTNWDVMNNGTKTLSLVLVSIVFFIFSWFSGSKLKIVKTSFAFWILGSLLMPITIVSVGFFQLLGNWLSVFGEGRYLLGLLGAIICFPVYVYSAYKYKNKIFIWISLTTLSIGVIFGLAAMYLPLDVMCLGIIIYNSILILSYKKLKNNEKIKVFIKEYPVFTQIHLVLSTIFILYIFNNKTFYGLNLIVLSIVYMFAVYSYDIEEYSFGFTGLIVYGIYQFTEHSGLVSIDVIIFALIGFIFLILEKYFIKKESLKKFFTHASGVVAWIVFVFILIISNLMKSNKPSLYILLSYVLITANYFYLAYKTKLDIYSYLTIIFFMIIGNQGYVMLKQQFNGTFIEYEVYMSLVAFAIFMLFYLFNKWKYTQCIKKESAITSILAMTIFIGQGIYLEHYNTTALLLYLYVVILFIIYKKAEFLGNELVTILMPISLYLGMIMPYKFIENKLFLESSFLWGVFAGNKKFDIVMYFLFCAVVIFLISIVLRKIKSDLEKSFFWLSQVIILGFFSYEYFKGLFYSFNFVIITFYALCVYVYSTLKYKDEILLRIFLYGTFTSIYIFILQILHHLNVSYSKYGLSAFITSIIIFIIWFICKEPWKTRVFHYFIPFSLLGVILLNVTVNSSFYFILSCINLALILYAINDSKIYSLNLIALLVLWGSLDNFYSSILRFNDKKIFMFYVVVFFILKIIGQLLSKRLFIIDEVKNKCKFIDWYSVFALIILVCAQKYRANELWLKMILSILIVYFLYSQIKRVEGVVSQKITTTLSIVSVLIPYYVLLGHIYIWDIIEMEVYILIWIPIMLIIFRKVWKEYGDITRTIEWVIITVIALILLVDVVKNDYLVDALILGILSLASIIAGAQFKVKSFFFVGFASLLLTVFIKTLHFWTIVPWWVYLLVAGIILIATASIHEMQKNKESKLVKLNKDEVIRKFEGWK